MLIDQIDAEHCEQNRPTLRKWKVFTDGGCPSNPGPGSWGFVIKVDDVVTEEYSGFLPSCTNNQAEYRALEAACHILYRKPQDQIPHVIEFFSDSQLIVNQINKRFKVNSPIQPYYETAATAFEILSIVSLISLTWIRREGNIEADALCNKVLDKYGVVCVKKGKRRDE